MLAMLSPDSLFSHIHKGVVLTFSSFNVYSSTHHDVVPPHHTVVTAFTKALHVTFLWVVFVIASLDLIETFITVDRASCLKPCSFQLLCLFLFSFFHQFSVAVRSKLPSKNLRRWNSSGLCFSLSTFLLIHLT